MNARSSLIPTSTEAGYGSTPAALNASSKKQSTTTRSRVVAAVAGVCGVVGVVALRASGVATFAAEGEALTFDKVLAGQVRTRTDRAYGSSVLLSRAAYALACSRQIRGPRRARTPTRGERARAYERAGASNAEARLRARMRVSSPRAPRAALPSGRSTSEPNPRRTSWNIPCFSQHPNGCLLTDSHTIFFPDVSFFRIPVDSSTLAHTPPLTRLTSAPVSTSRSPRTWPRSTRTARRVSSS